MHFCSNDYEKCYVKKKKIWEQKYSIYIVYTSELSVINNPDCTRGKSSCTSLHLVKETICQVIVCDTHTHEYTYQFTKLKCYCLILTDSSDVINNFFSISLAGMSDPCTMHSSGTHGHYFYIFFCCKVICFLYFHSHITRLNSSESLPLPQRWPRKLDYSVSCNFCLLCELQ